MRTTGGCRCHAELRTAERIKVERGIHAFRTRLALAAERLKEPHAGSCTIGCWDKGLDDRTMACTCGKDSDMARILEGR